jgi:mono/diheme cytochrome c family protein
VRETREFLKHIFTIFHALSPHRFNRMKWLISVLAIVLLGVLGAIGFAYSGAFNVAADEPHSSGFLWLVDTTREQSIQSRAKSVQVPDLKDPDVIMAGGADYNEMCTECHLKPGKHDSELRAGMYPRPPDLTRTHVDPAQAFWIIKHGIKMSGMPAWGATHDDKRMWAMVAFLLQLPRLTPEQYQILSARSDDDADESTGSEDGDDHDHAHEHEHEHEHE